MERDFAEKKTDVLKSIVERSHEQVRLEVMWDPLLADPEIHLSEEELDEFLSSFSDDSKGKQLKEWLETNLLRCEAEKETNGDLQRCENRAIASVDWTGVTHGNSIYACREDVRPVYRYMMIEVVAKQGVSPNVTINGKEVPKP